MYMYQFGDTYLYVNTIICSPYDGIITLSPNYRYGFNILNPVGMSRFRSI